MSNRRQDLRSMTHRLRGWLISSEAFAAVAAANGDPAPLLGLYGSRRARRPSRTRVPRHA